MTVGPPHFSLKFMKLVKLRFCAIGWCLIALAVWFNIGESCWFHNMTSHPTCHAEWICDVISEIIDAAGLATLVASWTLKEVK